MRRAFLRRHDMIPATLKLTRNHAEAWDRHWAPGTMGHASPGRAFLAGLSGLAVDFMNETLSPEIDTVAGTQEMLKLVAASGALSLATPLKYFIPGTSLVLKAGSTTIAGVPATTGIIPYSALQPRARGILNMELADVNAESVVSLSSHGLNWLRLQALQSWEITFNLVYVVNYDILAANGGAEFGVGSTDTDDDPANPIATRFCTFRLSDGKIFLDDETTSGIAQVTLPDGPTALTLKYDAARHAINAYVNGLFLGQSPCNAAFTVAGVTCRVYHTAAYLAATDAPLAVGLDSIVALNPPTFG